MHLVWRLWSPLRLLGVQLQFSTMKGIRPTYRDPRKVGWTEIFSSLLLLKSQNHLTLDMTSIKLLRSGFTTHPISLMISREREGIREVRGSKAEIKGTAALTNHLNQILGVTVPIPTFTWAAMKGITSTLNPVAEKWRLKSLQRPHVVTVETST